MKKSKTFLYLLAALSIVTVLAIRIYIAQKETLLCASHNLSIGMAVLVDDKATPESLSALLNSRGYIKDTAESDYIARYLVGCIRGDFGRPSSVKDLGKERYGVVLDSAGFEAISAFPYLYARAEKLAGGMDIDPRFRKYDVRPELSKKYSVRIQNKEGGLHRDTIYLCIKEHYNDLVEKD